MNCICLKWENGHNNLYSSLSLNSILSFSCQIFLIFFTFFPWTFLLPKPLTTIFQQTVLISNMSSVKYQRESLYSSTFLTFNFYRETKKVVSNKYYVIYSIFMTSCNILYHFFLFQSIFHVPKTSKRIFPIKI